MKRKTALALACISITLLASFALVPLTSSSPGSETHRYIVMGGITTASTQIGSLDPEFWKVPFATRPPYLTPNLMCQNITFSDPWLLAGYGWIVNLTVPAASYVGLEHIWWNPRLAVWFRWSIDMAEDGYGWLFLNATGDVDCYTFNNDTGSFWLSPSPKAGLKAAGTGELPSPGPDGVAGTADDGFGNGVVDPPGSSVLYSPTTLSWYWWDEVETSWSLLVSTSFPMVMTTATAYDIVIEPASLIDGVNSTETGQPWEYYAGLDHPEQHVNHGHPKWNVYVHYACAWSMLNIETPAGYLDIMWQIVEKKVREDCVIADINCDEIADFKDLYMVARAFGTRDEGVGWDGIPGTGDDKPIADPGYDARCDLYEEGIIDIYDLVKVALDYDFIPWYHVPQSLKGKISVVPSSTATNQVNITVSDVTDLYLALFCIHWNPAVLNLTKDPTPGDFLPSPNLCWYARINRTGGYLEGWVGTMAGAFPGVTGSGTIATLEFEVVGSGSSPLDLYNCIWMNSTSGQYGFETVQEDYSYHAFNATKNGETYNIAAISNSTITNAGFNYGQQNMSFNVEGPSGTTGFCKVILPKELMVLQTPNDTIAVLVNNKTVQYTLQENATHYFIFFTYSHSISWVQLLVTILGDINGDRNVDIVDIVLCALAFGSAAVDDPETPEDETENWNPLVDLYQDGIIDIVDIVTIAIRFGEIW